MAQAVGRVFFAVGTLVCLAAGASAQQTSTATETKTFEVIAVDGNQLVVRLPDGTRELTVPDDFRFNVDGRSMSVRELKPGMKGTATITTTTTSTPVSVTEVRNGTVMRASGASIVVRTDEGIRMFTQSDADKRGVRILREGQPAAISDLRAGDRLTATIVTAKPPRVVTEKELQATLARGASGAAAEAARAPTAGAASTATPTAGTAGATAAGATAAGAAPRKLPKTASPLPLLGLAGIASLATAAALRARRRQRSS
jgi:LPXTG-motif cell wall-anchored protein